ncbi:hypothetical protein CROQUDRAFT_666033 [Cronartium quercuum f. sp. fusiforme G11]|uniref:Uncharacterized protein n=1 Tax=Cronartium quercuum f. sp. fusiforme G11 TaxID=708437 RepID=A0A9P6T5V3_9BASI|nr:hypothetical protein CROQUDRAFT_666033 [Cronartium quercuum f. sp. fusiforme G11]
MFQILINFLVSLLAFAVVNGEAACDRQGFRLPTITSLDCNLALEKFPYDGTSINDPKTEDGFTCNTCEVFFKSQDGSHIVVPPIIAQNAISSILHTCGNHSGSLYLDHDLAGGSTSSGTLLMGVRNGSGTKCLAPATPPSAPKAPFSDIQNTPPTSTFPNITFPNITLPIPQPKTKPLPTTSPPPNITLPIPRPKTKKFPTTGPTKNPLPGITSSIPPPKTESFATPPGSPQTEPLPKEPMTMPQAGSRLLPPPTIFNPMSPPSKETTSFPGLITRPPSVSSPQSFTAQMPSFSTIPMRTDSQTLTFSPLTTNPAFSFSNSAPKLSSFSGEWSTPASTPPSSNPLISSTSGLSKFGPWR